MAWFYYVCSAEYLNNPEVQKTLHVDSRPVPLDWNFCNDEINENWSFSDFLADTTHLYGEIFNHPNKRKDFKMLVFSGDSDGVCATVGTQHWIYNVKNAKLLSLFKPWKYDDTRYGRQQGGFLTQFTGYLSFATVHYAGHEVPAYQPQKALTLFSRYLNGTLFANYKTSSEMTGQDNNEDSGEEKKDSGSGVLIAVLVSLLVVMTCLGASYVMSPQIKKIVGPNRRGSIGVAELPTHASTSHNPML
ncbi:hypothetical protein EON65_14390 [archaeon]|nr:MAG: hypothetical protein EON65_14390 [archaeon]